MRSLSINQFTALCLVVFAAATSAGDYDNFPRSDSHLLLEYHRYSDKLTNRDPTPRVRLYGSGRLIVYFPTYLRRAGTYEANLSQVEMDQLVSALETGSVATLASEEVETEAALAAAAQEALTGVLTYRSEQVTTRLTLALNAAPAEPTRLQVTNLLSRARELNAPTLGNLAIAERAVLALTEHPGLRRVGAAKAITP